MACDYRNEPPPANVEVDVPSLTESLTYPQPIYRPWDRVFTEWNKNSILAKKYEAYLERCHSGGFVALARAHLEAILEDAAPQCAIRRTKGMELSFWESVRPIENPTVIRAYLEKYPDGEFSALAGSASMS